MKNIRKVLLSLVVMLLSMGLSSMDPIEKNYIPKFLVIDGNIMIVRTGETVTAAGGKTKWDLGGGYAIIPIKIYVSTMTHKGTVSGRVSTKLVFTQKHAPDEECTVKQTITYKDVEIFVKGKWDGNFTNLRKLGIDCELEIQIFEKWNQGSDVIDYCCHGICDKDRKELPPFAFKWPGTYVFNSKNLSYRVEQGNSWYFL